MLQIQTNSLTNARRISIANSGRMGDLMIPKRPNMGSVFQGFPLTSQPLRY